MFHINKFKLKKILLMNDSEKDDEGFYYLLKHKSNNEYYQDSETHGILNAYFNFFI